MSLNEAEVRRTAAELRQNLAVSGLTPAEVADDLGMSPERLQSTLQVRADPADVWLLRDYLDQAIRDAGREPEPFTVLTSQSRELARGWYRLRTAPHHHWAAGTPGSMR